MVYKFLAASFIVLSGGAMASDCHFTTECYEDEACQSSDYLATISSDVSTLYNEHGDLPIMFQKTHNNGANTYLSYTESAVYVMTVAHDKARLSVHMTDGPELVSYLGTCVDADQ